METLNNLFATNEFLNKNQKIALVIFIPIAIALIYTSLTSNYEFIL